MKTIHALSILLSLSLSACGTAAVARRDATGGQVALHGGYMRSVREARVLMAESCKGQFDVTEFQHGLSFQCRESTLASLAQR
jgi:hypothetical protein